MSTIKVSKNGSDFFDIDDSDDSVGAAKAKGYSEYVPMTKNGKDVFNVQATDDSYKAALSKGYKDVDRYKFEQPAVEDLAKPSKNESVVRGGIHGLTQGFGDEAGGALEAAGSAVGVRGLGSPNLEDIHRASPAEASQSFGDVYRQGRDNRRAVNKQAEEANPGAYRVGDVAGSLATGVLIPGGATLRGAAAIGAVQGLGRSDADLTKGEIGEAAADTATGAATGLAGGLVGKALPAVAKGIISPVQSLKAMARGAEAGAQAASEGLEHVPGVNTVATVAGAIKGAFTELNESGAAKKEFASVADDARKALTQAVPPEDLGSLASQARADLTKEVATKPAIRRLQDLQAIGNGKTIEKMSDDEAVLAALMSDGDNAVKKWVAEKAATTQPGQIDKDAYQNVLGLGSDARNTARDFNPREAAARLKPTVEQVQDLFKGARDTRFKQLQDTAREGFQSEHGAPVLSEVDSAIQDADALKSIPGSVRGVLQDIHGMLNEGQGTRLQKLTPGPWAESETAEQFNRLQKARQLLDGQINWASREGHGQAESILRGLRDTVNDALKTSPEKVEADALYRSSKDVEGKFFGATEFRNPAGGVDIDEGKLSRVLGNTDQAHRFKDAMGELKQFAQNPDLAPEFRQKAGDLIKQIESEMGTAENKRVIGALRQANGPSSPAIERVGSAAGGNSLVQDAVQSPAGFTNQLDQFNKTLQDRLGKTYSQLGERDKAGAVKFLVWLKNNPGASQATTDTTFARLLAQ